MPLGTSPSLAVSTLLFAHPHASHRSVSSDPACAPLPVPWRAASGLCLYPPLPGRGGRGDAGPSRPYGPREREGVGGVGTRARRPRGASGLKEPGGAPPGTGSNALRRWAGPDAPSRGGGRTACATRAREGPSRPAVRRLRVVHGGPIRPAGGVSGAPGPPHGLRPPLRAVGAEGSRGRCCEAGPRPASPLERGRRPIRAGRRPRRAGVGVRPEGFSSWNRGRGRGYPHPSPPPSAPLGRGAPARRAPPTGPGERARRRRCTPAPRRRGPPGDPPREPASGPIGPVSGRIEHRPAAGGDARGDAAERPLGGGPRGPPVEAHPPVRGGARGLRREGRPRARPLKGQGPKGALPSAQRRLRRSLCWRATWRKGPAEAHAVRPPAQRTP